MRSNTSTLDLIAAFGRGQGLRPTVIRPKPLRKVDGTINERAWTDFLDMDNMIHFKHLNVGELMRHQRLKSIQFTMMLEQEDHIIDEFCGLKPPPLKDSRKWNPQYPHYDMVMHPDTGQLRTLLNIVKPDVSVLFN